MPTVLDVAAYVLNRTGAIPAMKLQKLAYYCQAWSLVWDEKPLFADHIEAWANGPVVPSLFAAHRGAFLVSPGELFGNPAALGQQEAATVEAVLHHYGDKSSQWLSDLTHNEPPWQNARVGLAAGERGSREITLAAMSEYYSSL